jgi:hypothetical protein
MLPGLTPGQAGSGVPASAGGLRPYVATDKGELSDGGRDSEGVSRE